jgi:sodium-dependent phosphate transporter
LAIINHIQIPFNYFLTVEVNLFRNSIGPVLALYSVAETCKPFMSGCNIDQMNPPQSWIISIGCAGIVLGLWTLGKRVIKTVGKDIAKITPARGFAIDIMAGFTVLFGSMLQIPLSTTHCKVGAVVAVSLVHDRSAVSMSTFRSIILAWGVTLPVSGAISALAYTILKTFV